MNEKTQGIIQSIRLPDLITTLGALIGFIAILSVLHGDESGALVLILLAATADGLDGIVARKIEHGVFGPSLDSFADLIVFVTAPAVVFYSVYSGVYPHPAAALCGAYVICGMLRLARFDAFNPPDTFQGVPTTGAAICISSFMLFQVGVIGIPLVVGLLLLGILSVLMISDLPYPKVVNKLILAPFAVIILVIVFMHYYGGPMQSYAHPMAGVLFGSTVLYLFAPIILRGKVI